MDLLVDHLMDPSYHTRCGLVGKQNESNMSAHRVLFLADAKEKRGPEGQMLLKGHLSPSGAF